MKIGKKRRGKRMRKVELFRKDAAIEKVWKEEKLLVFTGLLGFVLAAGTLIYIALFGAIRLPEGNLERAFSFNAAIAIFVLSMAMLMPLAGLTEKKRKTFRWLFIVAALYSYGIETIQHFRGINPRFSEVASGIDQLFNAIFALISILFIVVTILFAIPFFRKHALNNRPLLLLSIRYAFLSIMLAYGAGIWMIILQSSFTGVSGNIIVLHGIGFHALQALPLLGWLAERACAEEKQLRWRVHLGGVAWTCSLLFIALQTLLGETVFQFTLLPLLAGAMLLSWGLITIWLLLVWWKGGRVISRETVEM